MTDDYGLGQRDSLQVGTSFLKTPLGNVSHVCRATPPLRVSHPMQEAVEAITSILGMAASEGSDAVPPNARSHTLLLAGKLIGDAQARVL